jgi:glycosyltransferase involved in cell wall biosynthesis
VLTVLHVVESWGGGVSSAVADYVASTPGVRHWLAVGCREGEDTGVRFGAGLLGVRRLPLGHVARVRAVADSYRELRPDVVHAHSFFAGLYVRVCPSIPRERIVFTPHCYAFERLDLGAAGRGFARGLEAALARRTGIVAGVSPYEVALARGRVVTYVPNTLPGQTPQRRVMPPVVVAVGRICPQKDPEFLAQAARKAGKGARWIWIGDGDHLLKRRLNTAGIAVTGWVPRTQVQELLAAASIYVHTARWEGAPLAVLEAVGAGLPVIARDIPSLRSLSVPCLVRTPGEMAAVAMRLAADPSARRANADRTREALSECNREVQAARLLNVYAMAAGRELTPALAGASGERRMKRSSTPLG